MSEALRAQALLSALQNADSFFPSGAMAFSWGLEGLHRDGVVHDAASLVEFVDTQLLHRWASCDQGLLAAAAAIARAPATAEADTLHAWCELDAHAEAINVIASLREGSRRLGRTMASVHARLGNPGAAALNALVEARRTPGHLAVVQGYLWTLAGMSELEARAASAHTTCSGAVSAAVRLSLIGHLDAQRALLGLRERLAAVLAAPAPALEELSSCAFAIDIAALRHGQLDARLFAN